MRSGASGSDREQNVFRTDLHGGPLLDTNLNPSDDDIRQARSGNLCRCNAYGRIIQSVREATKLEGG